MSNEGNANKTIEKLWSSLARGGTHWGEDVLLTETEEAFEAHFYLRDRLPPGASSHIQNYVKHFMRLEGWKANTRVTKYYLRVAFSKD